MIVVGGIQKYTIGCNWKLAVDNVWDFYHPRSATHRRHGEHGRRWPRRLRRPHQTTP